jgi:hypothetical protein
MLDIDPVIMYPHQETDIVLINIERVSVVSITLSDSTNGHVILPNSYLIVPISHISSIKTHIQLITHRTFNTQYMYKNRSDMINNAQI